VGLPPAGLAWRATGLLAMVLFAFAAVGTAIDRVAAVRPLWAVAVPPMLAENAWRSQASLALQRGDSTAAMAAATQAVARGPVEPGSPDLLGSALLLANQPEAAAQAFRVAGRMGWRRAATQVYWMKQALHEGDWPAATRRLDALLRQTPTLAGNAATLQPFETSVGGRAALAARLSTQPPWVEPYVKLVDSLPAPQLDARAVVLRSAAAAGHLLGCRSTGPIVTALIERGLPAEADAVWRAHCPAAAGGLLGNGAFADVDLPARNSPFAWWAPPVGEVSVWADRGDPSGQAQVAVTSSASFPREAVNRMVYLPAGHYRLSWQAVAEDGRASDRIDAVIACQPADGEPLPKALESRRGRAVAEVSWTGVCLAPWLNFRIRPGTGQIRFGSVRLEQLH